MAGSACQVWTCCIREQCIHFHALGPCHTSGPQMSSVFSASPTGDLFSEEPWFLVFFFYCLALDTRWESSWIIPLLFVCAWISRKSVKTTHFCLLSVASNLLLVLFTLFLQEPGLRWNWCSCVMNLNSAVQSGQCLTGNDWYPLIHTFSAHVM